MKSDHVRVYRGSCSAVSGGTAWLVFPLADVARSGERAAGDRDAPRVGVATTSLSVALADLLGGQHVVAAFDDEEKCLVCGPISGAVDEKGNLFLGFKEIAASGYTGIGWLLDGGDGATTATVFLVEGLCDTPAGAAAPRRGSGRHDELPRDDGDDSSGARAEKPKRSGSGGARGAEIAGSILAVPLGLVGCLLSTIVSFAIPALVISALVQGPAGTWDMLRRWIPGTGDEGEPACAGFDAWFDQTVDRHEQAFRLFDGLGPGIDTADPAELQRVSVTIDRIATEQEQSNPPEAARRYNDIAVDGMRLIPAAIEAVSSRDYRTFYDTRDKLEALSPQLDEEGTTLVERCG